MVRHPSDAASLHVVDPWSRRQLLRRLGRGGLAAAAVATHGGAPALAQTPAASPGAMPTVAEAWAAAWNSHDPAQMAALFTPDGLYEDMAFGFVSHGTEEITAFANELFTVAPDVRIDLRAGFGTEVWAAAEWLFSGTDMGGLAGAPTGKRFEVRGASIFEVADGKIRRVSDYYNAGTILEQLGVLPAPATPSA